MPLVLTACGKTSYYEQELGRTTKSEFREVRGQIPVAFELSTFERQGQQVYWQGALTYEDAREEYQWTEVERARIRSVDPNALLLLNPIAWFGCAASPEACFGETKTLGSGISHEDESKTGRRQLLPRQQRYLGEYALTVVADGRALGTLAFRPNAQGAVSADLGAVLGRWLESPADALELVVSPAPNPLQAEVRMPLSGRALLDGGVVVPRWNTSAMVQAISRGEGARIQALLQRDVQAFDQTVAVNDQGDSLVGHALRHNMPGIARTMIEKGFEPGRANRQGQTPLLLAAAQGDLPTVDLLVRRAEALSLNLEQGDGQGRTALHHASLNGHDAVAALLIRAGVSYEKADAAGVTAQSLIQTKQLPASGRALALRVQQASRAERTSEVLEWLSE